MQFLHVNAGVRKYHPAAPHTGLFTSLCEEFAKVRNDAHLESVFHKLQHYLKLLPTLTMEEETAASIRLREVIPLSAMYVHGLSDIRVIPATRGQTIGKLLIAAISSKRVESSHIASRLLKNDKWVADAVMLAKAVKAGLPDMVHVLLSAGADASVIDLNIVPKIKKRQCKNKECNSSNCNIALVEMLYRAGGISTSTSLSLCQLGTSNFEKTMRESEDSSIALAMGMHERLGEGSLLKGLDPELICMIMQQVEVRRFERVSAF